MIPSLLGYAVIAAFVGLAAVLTPDEDVRHPMWLFVFLAVVAGAHFCWSHPKAPTEPLAWLKYVFVAIAVGVGLAVIDMVIYGLNDGHVILDFFLAAIGVAIAVSGALRSFALGKQNDGSQETHPK